LSRKIRNKRHFLLKIISSEVLFSHPSNPRYLYLLELNPDKGLRWRYRAAVGRSTPIGFLSWNYSNTLGFVVASIELLRDKEWQFFKSKEIDTEMLVKRQIKYLKRHTITMKSLGFIE